MNITTRKERLYAELKTDILSGAYLGNRKFPPEPEFAATLGVSRNTLRSVYKLLAAEGLIVRHPGSGTFPATASEAGAERYLFVYGDHPRHHTANNIVPAIFRGAERALAPGCELDSCSVEELTALGQETAKSICRARNIRGIILRSNNFNGDEPILRLLRTLHIPVVLIYCAPEDYAVTGFAAIPSSIRAAWRSALHYLSAIGHRRVLSFSSRHPLIRNEFTPEKYRAMLTELGLDPDPELVLHCPLDGKEIHRQLTAAASKKFSVIFCYSDFYALPIYRSLKKLGRRIPEDISVIGYCGSGGGEYLSPPLTTIEIDYGSVGADAVRMLNQAAEWFERPGVPLPLSAVRFRLRPRASTRRLNTEPPDSITPENSTAVPPKKNKTRLKTGGISCSQIRIPSTRAVDENLL